MKHEFGLFPKNIVNFYELNSEFDNYNVIAEKFYRNIAMIYSNSIKSSGIQFNLEQGAMAYMFVQITGEFVLTQGMILGHTDGLDLYFTGISPAK